MRVPDVSFWRIMTIATLFAAIIESPSASKLVAANTADRNTTLVRIGVFGLFHPTHLVVTAIPGQALLLQAGREQVILENSSGKREATLQLSGADVVVSNAEDVFRSPSALISGRNGEAVGFQLAIPGKISRRYNGTLEVRGTGSELVVVVVMDLETAVASVVGAENLSDTPVEAIKAQAVAVRSYLVSGRGRHLDFDFCDTTHCQFLREPARPGTVVSRAVGATGGLVLSYDAQPFPAMYTRSCSGHTRTPAQLGLSSNGYPYYGVECQYCLSHPAYWNSRISLKEAASLRSSDETSRLQVARRLGWNTVPSNDFTSTTSGNVVFLHGTGYGHGVGLCQAGARAMAEHGTTFQEILAHYYPNTGIVEWKTGN